MAIRTDIFTIDWDVSPRVIWIDISETEVSAQDLYDTCKHLEALYSGVDEPAICDAGGWEPVGDLFVGITVSLFNAVYAFAARPGPAWVICNMTGGNVVAFEDETRTVEIYPRKPTAYVSADRTASSAATLISGSGGVTVDEIWDEVLTGATHNVAASAGRRLRALGDVVAGEVVADSGNSISQFMTDLTEARDDFYNDQLIRFTSGNLQGYVVPIFDYDGTTKTIIVSEVMIEIPDDGITFDIIPMHVHPVEQIIDAMWDELVAGHVTANSFADLLTVIGRMAGNKITMSGDIATVYLDDEATPWRQYDLANDERIPV